MGGGDEFQGLDASITIVPSPEVFVETVNWHLRGAEIIYLPNGYKEVEGPAERGPKGPFLPARYEVSHTQATVLAYQVQNPVNSRTPI